MLLYASTLELFCNYSYTLYGNVVTELKDIPTFWIYELYWLLMSSNELYMSFNKHLTKSFEHKLAFNEL